MPVTASVLVVIDWADTVIEKVSMADVLTVVVVHEASQVCSDVSAISAIDWAEGKVSFKAGCVYKAVSGLALSSVAFSSFSSNRM